MKNLTALILAAGLLCSIFAGCKNNVVDQDENDQSNYVPETVIMDNDKEEVIDGFELKWKKYYYNGNPLSSTPAGNVLILNATNTTETNYTVRFRVTFLDENGEQIRKEAQSIRDFPAANSQFIIFKACPDYSSYTTEVILTEYTDESYASHISFDFFTQIRETYEDPLHSNVKLSTLTAQSGFKFDCEIPNMYITYDVVLFDNTGEIYIIYTVGTSTDNESNKNNANYSSFNLVVASKQGVKVETPPELTGELPVLFALKNIKVNDK